MAIVDVSSNALLVFLSQVFPMDLDPVNDNLSGRLLYYIILWFLERNYALKRRL